MELDAKRLDRLLAIALYREAALDAPSFAEIVARDQHLAKGLFGD